MSLKKRHEEMGHVVMLSGRLNLTDIAVRGGLLTRYTRMLYRRKS